ncbi:gliding motility-associated-like protein [Myroides gitamensis]|uniref:choice-of-anchor J domain-containing protein n=1 Tax=Myroides odoratus TaxID=256 RepID=UPI002167E1ED|nr:choice-of-anchor J domain-containing protein [Myroides odoratus]MCS4238321.1 gliding motility-associated-like protein [Myroides odoratus]MDH6600874.1 gliding motility-associated-like protein [Myroides gitamensis]
MAKRKQLLKGVLLALLVIPAFVLASPKIKVWMEDRGMHWFETSSILNVLGGNDESTLFFEDPTTCTVITTLPFVETFASDSPTKECWTVVDGNEDDNTWDLNYGSNPYVGDQVAILYTDYNDGDNDDWLISPTIQLNGNQRLRYFYRVQSEGEPNDFRVMLSTNGTAPANFTRELVPLNQYSNIEYREEIVYLADENGTPFTGNVNIAWHVPPGGLDGWRLYIDNVIVEDIPACPTPSGITVSNRTVDSAQINWTAGYQEEEWEVAVQIAGTGEPTSGVEVQAATYNATQLISNTAYEVYVRAKCTDDESSDWVGPVNFSTQMVPTALPFIDDFEGTNNFVFLGNKVNKWVVGTAVNNGGTHAMYISDDEGVSHHYETEDEDWESTVAHAYKDFTIDADVNELQLTFDWLCMGDSEFWPSDYFKVWVVPTDYVLVTNEEIDEDEDGVVQIGQSNYYWNNVFQSELIFFDGTPYAGSTVRLVFEWVNDAFGGTQPPAAIDNVNLSKVLCSRPQNLTVNAVTSTSFTVGWTPATGVDNYEFLLRTNPLPLALDTDVATHSATGNTYTFANLTTGSFYYVWMRTACDATTKSKWIGPIAVNIPNMTAQALPYNESFEEDVYFQTTQNNFHQWVAGNAVSAYGTRSLYVTNNSGVRNTYNVDEETVIHAFKDFIVPANTQQLDISFVWRAMGDFDARWDDEPNDFMKVWMVPASFTPTADTPITPAANRIEIDPTTLFVNANQFTVQRNVVDVTAFAGQNMRLVFEWIQNSYSGTQPPAAVDNIVVKIYTCKDVTDLNALLIENTNNFEITWIPGPGQTKWEVFIIENGEPYPTESDTGIIVEGDPSYIVEDVPEETFYKVFVRPICSDTEKGWWTGPKDYSIFHPPGCAGITLDDIELNISADGDYIICSDDPYTLDLKANYYDIKATTDYTVEAIDYAPPFPFFGGDAVNLTLDDDWSDIIDLGFDFCFYGNSYNKVLISANGAITFSIEGVVPGGLYEPGTRGGWEFFDPIPFVGDFGDPPFANAIFGVLQDTNPEESPDNYSVNYQILGSYPCRALVFNIYQMGMFSCGYDEDDIEGSTATTQVVLYEGTNIVEVYVKNRIPCEDWNEGNGLIGMQNQDGTLAHFPADRNTGDWTAQNEAWRFTPDGESIASFEWLKDGEVLTTDTDITVTIEESTTYTGRIKYEHCNGEEMVIEKSFKFLKEPMILGTPKTVFDCAKKPGSTYTYNLDENIPNVLQQLNVDDFTIEYYATEAEAENGENQLETLHTTTDPLAETIFMKVTNNITECSKTVSFKLGINTQLGATKIKDIFVCKETILPALAEGEAYYTAPYGAGTRYNAGDRYDVVGINTLYVYHEDEKQCYGESNFKIEILPEVFAPVLESKVLTCEVFTLPELPADSKYYTGEGETGIELFEGYEVIVPMTIYVVTRNGNKTVYCYDESSFTIDFEDCPLPKGFSPNRDGINDSFDLTEYGVAKIQVFNRNGVEVYSHGLGYKNEWMGQDKSGNKLPSGTYYYVIVSHGKLKTGWVQLNY